MDDRDRVLDGLLALAGVDAAPTVVSRMTGRGFTDEVSRVDLDDGGRVVLRRWSPPRAPESARAAFLAAHDVPAPRLLAAAESASLVEFAPGRLLGDLIEDRRDTSTTWAEVGRAYRRVHAVGFPSGLAGRVEPDRLVLRPVDAVAVAHETLDAAAPGLARRCPDVLVHLPALRARVDRCATLLRAAPATLRHGDVNMWNVLVDDADGPRATLIDWDLPEVGDPAIEVALLDKHAALFNGTGLPEAFFAGYGPAAEPRTSLHRLIDTVGWVGSDDWDDFAGNHDLPEEQRARTASWLADLEAYLRALPRHLQRLDALITATACPAPGP